MPELYTATRTRNVPCSVDHHAELESLRSSDFGIVRHDPAKCDRLEGGRRRSLLESNDPNRRLRLKCAALFVAFVSLGTSPLLAEKSNQRQMRAELSRDGFNVAYGKMFTEAEWVAAAGSIYASVQSGNPRPFYEWMQAELEASLIKIRGQLPGIARNQVFQLIRQSLAAGKLVQLERLDIQAGVVTYRRWDEKSAHYPEFGPWGVKWTYGATKIALPNWHQPYVRFRVRNGNQKDPRDFGPKAPPQGVGDGFGPRSFPVFPVGLTVRVDNAQEISGDDIYLIVKPDGGFRNVQGVKGIGPTNRWQNLRKGNSRSIDSTSLRTLEFSRYLEVMIVEYDSFSKNEIIGTLHFHPGKRESRVIRKTSGRNCQYTVTVDSVPPPL